MLQSTNQPSYNSSYQPYYQPTYLPTRSLTRCLLARIQYLIIPTPSAAAATYHPTNHPANLMHFYYQCVYLPSSQATYQPTDQQPTNKPTYKYRVGMPHTVVPKIDFLS